MGTMPEGKLIINMSVPIMISMLIQALYNVVDSWFVSMLNTDAFAAVTLAFPIQMLMISVGTGTGVGINSLISRRLGERKFKEANASAENGIFLSILSGIIFALFGIFFAEQFIASFTDNPDVIKMGKEYLEICTVFSFGMFVQICMERIMQATGNSFYNMIVQGLGAIINIVLDPIFIFGLFGVPKMGVAGAAIATVIGQIIAMIAGLYVNIKKNDKISINMFKFRPNFRAIAEIYIVGIPAIIMQSISSVLTIGLNKILMNFSQSAVSVYGAYFKLQNFIFMPVFGLTNGMIPIVGYNYGAKYKDRIVRTVKIGVMISVSIMFLGMLLFQLLPAKLLLIFNADSEMLEIGTPALRIISISFMFAGVSIVLSSVFQAIGKAYYSLIISVIRQLIVILPVAYFMARFLGLSFVWTAFPIAEFIALILSTIMYVTVYKKYIKNL
ncbi:MAG: MATE family efflux transporter [Tyzzerella sp.]|uniref:Probable multidrug resistance protein NorM n=1 Tax=Candidatus Fimicola merdigallinarum TaxID=2840819 RepID=A0A9D9H3C8_9FIRM|nr:MATE family efflux transporter [Candidatus Fimicola merdigallinarum]